MRYFLTLPVPGGYAYYDVRDSRSPIYENFSVASFFKDMPGAEQEARALLARLNHS